MYSLILEIVLVIIIVRIIVTQSPCAYELERQVTIATFFYQKEVCSHPNRPCDMRVGRRGKHLVSLG